MGKNKVEKPVIIVMSTILGLALLCGIFFLGMDLGEKKKSCESIPEEKKETKKDEPIPDNNNTTNENESEEEIEELSIVYRVEDFIKRFEISWSNDETINITKVNNKKVISKLLYGSDTDTEEDYAPFLVTADGELYIPKREEVEALPIYDSSEEIEPEFIKFDIKIKFKRLGKILFGPLSPDICVLSELLALESTDGKIYIGYFDYDYINENSTFKIEKYNEVFNDPQYIDLGVVPSCGYEHFEGLVINNKKLIHFESSKEFISDNNKPIEAEYVVYAYKYNVEEYEGKYYIVSKDKKLYILDKVENNISKTASIKEINEQEVGETKSLILLLDNGEKLVFDYIWE